MAYLTLGRLDCEGGGGPIGQGGTVCSNSQGRAIATTIGCARAANVREPKTAHGSTTAAIATEQQGMHQARPQSVGYTATSTQ